MAVENNQYSVGLIEFLTGVIIGAGVALLLAPNKGAETRSMLKGYAKKAKEALEEGKATMDTAIEQGKQYTGEMAERGYQEVPRPTI